MRCSFSKKFSDWFVLSHDMWMLGPSSWKTSWTNFLSLDFFKPYGCDPEGFFVNKWHIKQHMTSFEDRDNLCCQLCVMQNRATREALTLSNLLTEPDSIVKISVFIIFKKSA